MQVALRCPVADIYTRGVATATRLITKYGRSMTLRTIARSGTSFDPTSTPTDTTIIGAVIEFKTHQINGSLVKQGDKRILFGSAVPVAKDDKIIDGSDEYSIVDFKTIAPGPVVVMYKAQVRK